MMSGILKRKLEEGPGPCRPLQGPENDEVSCSDSGNSSDSLYHPGLSGCPDASLPPQSKRLRGRNVHFESVTVYYFNRWQGFTSVPTQGGSSLGMLPRHSSVRRFTLREFALEQKRKHHNMLKEHLKEEKLNALRLKLTKNGTVSSVEAETLTLDDISEDDLDVDNAEVGDYFFLQPLTTSKRRALLRASGVRRIDVEEKHELRALRMSREECGCRCRGICDPETCACSLGGIKCQVDRLSFPCGCTKEGCSNTTGRLEFNPVRVRTHFLHTIMKLELEKGREEQQHRSEEQQRQQLVTNGNSYHGDSSFSTSLEQQRQQQEQNLEIPPHFPIMHLQNTGNTESHLDEEEEEEEEDEDDDEAYEEDEDGSSVCSGLSDCSTHSLDTIEGDEEEEEEEENDDDDEEEDEEDDQDWDCSLHAGPQPYLVPLPSMLARLSPPFHNTATTQHYQSDSAAFLSDSAPTLPTVEVALESEINTELHCRTFPGLQESLAVETQPPQSSLTSTDLQNIPDNCDTQTVDAAEQTEREEEARQPSREGLRTQGAPSEKADGLHSE